MNRYEHQQLGAFEADPSRPNCFAKAVAWDDGEATLILQDEQPTTAALDRAAKHFLNMRDNAEFVGESAADMAGEQLFAKWLFEWFGDEEVSLAEWKRGLKVDRIWVDPAGEIMVDFALNHPFEGHRATAAGKAPFHFNRAFLSV